MTARVVGDEATFDLTDCADETVGPVNLTYPYTDTSIFYALIALTEPEAGFTDGMRRPIHIVRRAGSVLDPRFPAPVGAAQSMKQRFTDLCFEALCPFVPERSIAHSGGSGGTLGISWNASVSGARSFQYEVFGSGMGAMQGRDGVSGVAVYTSNLAITPIEVIESMFPVLVRRFELAADSGGPGQHGAAALVTAASTRRSHRRSSCAVPNGRSSRRPASRRGWPGSLARVEIVDNEGCARQVPVAGRYELQPGERIGIQGAGRGLRLARSSPISNSCGGTSKACRHKREGAAHDYGVVLAADGSVDGEATEALRAAGLTPPAPVVVAEGAP